MLTIALSWGRPALAGEARAKVLYKEGATHFALGKFDKAILSWEAGYQEKPDPQFLYNIGQAHRLGGDPEKAIFFYRGYLRQAPDARNRADVEQKIESLQAQIERNRTIVPPPNPPPLVLPPASVAPAEVVAAKAPEPGADLTADRPVDLALAVGLGTWLSGDGGQGRPSFALNLGGGYKFGSPASAARFRLGGKLALGSLREPVGTAHVWSLLLAPGAVKAIGQRIVLVGELGLGVAVLTGARPGSTLLQSNIVAVDGALARFEARPALTAAYRLGPNTSVFLSPALAWNATRAGIFPAAAARVEIVAGASMHLGGRAR